MFFDKSLGAWFGFLDGQRSGISSAAEFLHRAGAALRFVRQANKGTQVDQRGIETRRVAPGDESRGMRPEFFAADCRIDWNLHIEQASEHTRAIRFHNGDRLIPSEAGNCVRSVSSKTRQTANRCNIAR